MIKSIYYTDRLALRLSNAGMSRRVLAYLIRNKEFLRSTEPVREDEFYTEKYQHDKLECDEKDFSCLHCVRFWVTYKNSSRIIGMVGLNEIVFGAFHSCFLSYRLDKGETGKGLMTEAVSKAVEIAFQDIGSASD